MIKALKRKVSRVQFESPDPSQLSIPSPALGVLVEGEVSPTVGTSSSSATSPPKGGGGGHSPLPCQYDYCRPELLGDYTKEQLQAFEHHQNRPVVVPKVGKAEENVVRVYKRTS